MVPHSRRLQSNFVSFHWNTVLYFQRVQCKYKCSVISNLCFLSSFIISGVPYIVGYLYIVLFIFKLWNIWKTELMSLQWTVHIRILVMNENGDLLADSHNILNRWKTSSLLLNVHRVSDVRQIEICTYSWAISTGP
jgi:hypothetical protein